MYKPTWVVISAFMGRGGTLTTHLKGLRGPLKPPSRVQDSQSSIWSKG